MDIGFRFSISSFAKKCVTGYTDANPFNSAHLGNNYTFLLTTNVDKGFIPDL